MNNNEVVRFIRLPFTEIIRYIAEEITKFPTGHRYHGEKLDNLPDQAMVEAVAEFTTQIVMLKNRQTAKEADPELALLRGLGYPVDDMSEDAVDDLIHCSDMIISKIRDYFEYTALPPTVSRLLRDHLFEIRVVDEDLVIHFVESLLHARISAMRREIELLTPPKLDKSTIDEIPEIYLSQLDDYIQRTMKAVFQEIESPALKEDIKELFQKALNKF